TGRPALNSASPRPTPTCSPEPNKTELKAPPPLLASRIQKPDSLSAGNFLGIGTHWRAGPSFPGVHRPRTRLPAAVHAKLLCKGQVPQALEIIFGRRHRAITTSAKTAHSAALRRSGRPVLAKRSGSVPRLVAAAAAAVGPAFRPAAKGKGRSTDGCRPDRPVARRPDRHRQRPFALHQRPRRS